MINLAAIFQDLEYLNEFQTISYESHFIFQNDAKIFTGERFEGHEFLWTL